ncbi:hypothetical protein JW823_01610 [bacterium]|nr:hypothetical protein [candidate division CSSED10-310 bacterium]
MLIGKKRCIFKIITTALVVISGGFALEVTGRIAYFISKHQLYNEGIFRHQLDIIQGEIPLVSTGADNLNPDSSEIAQPEIIHPYLGFVQNKIGGRMRVDAFGFPLNSDIPIHKRTETGYIIGVFGGSFAQGVATHRTSLVEAVAQTNRTPVIVNTAMGGYKQPQQLLALTYLLSLGAEFDAVINIDGFNEVALPMSENLPKSVFPFFPRNWYFRTTQRLDQTTHLMLGELQYLKRERRAWANLAEENFSLKSICWFALWRFRERQLSSRINCL